jgi:NitT/TauT family transport system permease protein
MIRRPISRKSHIALGVLSVVLLALAYTWLSHRQHVKNPRDTTIPNWSQLKEGVVKVFTPSKEYRGQPWIWVDAKATFARHFTGLAVGVLLAVILGLLMGCYAPAAAFFVPPLSFLAKIPPTAMLAVFFVLVGLDFKMYITMIAFGVLPTLAQAVYQSARDDVPEELVFKAYTLGAGHLELIWNVIYKQVLPRILEAVRLQVGPAMVYLIAAEMLGADIGFGYRIRLHQRLLNMNVVYVYLVALGLAGYLMDFSLSYTRKKLCPWFGS